MIFIAEQSTKENNGRIFSWRGSFFKAIWGGKDKSMWRLMWGIWSISYYPAIGLKAFFDYVREGNTEWKFTTKKSTKKEQIKILWEALKEQHTFRCEDELSIPEMDDSWSFVCNRINEKIFTKGKNQ